jgi:hypothetical protein
MILTQNKDNQITLLKDIIMRAAAKLVLMLIAINPFLYANPDKLHGKWNIESVIRDGKVETLLPEDPAYMEFSKDTMTYTMGRQGKIATSGSWRIEGDKVILIEEYSTKENIVIIKFHGDKCTMSTPDGKIVVNLKQIKSE